MLSFVTIILLYLYHLKLFLGNKFNNNKIS